MPIELIAIRQGENLIPANENARHAFSHVREGQVVRVTVTHQRNGPWLRAYWALVDMIYDAAVDTIVYPDRNDYHEALKIMCGVRRRIILPADLRNEYGEVILPAGSVCFTAGSIAYNNMSQPTFSRFFFRLCNLIVTYWLPTQTEAWLRNEVSKLIRYELPKPEPDDSPLVIPTDIEPDDRTEET